MLSDAEKIKLYYEKALSQLEWWTERRDKFSYWGLTLLFALLSIYAIMVPYSQNEIYLVAFLLFGLLLMIRLYILSVISYSYVVKYREIVRKIEEKLIANETNKLDDIWKKIKTHDHQGYTTYSMKRLLFSQLKTGYLLIFSSLIILIAYQVYLSNNPFVCVLIFLSLIYIAYEIIIFITYTPVNTPKEV